jgi:hypothetical protein
MSEPMAASALAASALAAPPAAAAAPLELVARLLTLISAVPVVMPVVPSLSDSPLLIEVSFVLPCILLVPTLPLTGLRAAGASW